ncbi:MAG TPA: CvpA family protein [Candidatus Limnocylindrales bacterium]|nr:CvpA family protein [Candidatus Limnocylindrales bacterium]
MDLAETIRSLTVGDLLLVLIFLAAFVVGYLQGLIRQLLGVLIWFISFALALSLREPVGAFLQQYWTQFVPDYTNMLAFALVFLILLVGGNLIAQFTYKHVPVLAGRQFADEFLGAVLSLCLVIVEAACILFILDTFYRHQTASGTNTVAVFTSTFDLFKDSVIAGGLRNGLMPGLLAILGPFVPAGLSALAGS